jgi:hypothetical protein
MRKAMPTLLHILSPPPKLRVCCPVWR